MDKTHHNPPQKGEITMGRNLTYDNVNACCIPYDSPPPGISHQLQRLAEEGRPGACLGCGFEQNCATRGCTVLRKVSRIVAVMERK